MAVYVFGTVWLSWYMNYERGFLPKTIRFLGRSCATKYLRVNTATTHNNCLSTNDSAACASV